MRSHTKEEARLDRQDDRKIAGATRLVQEALGTRPVIRWQHEGHPRMVVESYLSPPSSGITYPALPMSAIGIVLDGRIVRNLRKPDASARTIGKEEFISLPNRCALVPKGVISHWHPSPGSVSFAGVYIAGLAQEALESLTAGNTQTASLRDSLLAALTRQLIRIAKERRPLPPHYAQRLVDTFTSQLEWVAAGQKKDIPKRSTSSDPAISKALQLIDAHLEEPITIQWLCDSVQTSPVLLRRRFQQATGMPIHQYILTCRVERARELIEETHLAFAVIAAHCGFSSQSHMTAVFKRITGVTPGEQRQASSSTRNKAAS